MPVALEQLSAVYCYGQMEYDGNRELVLEISPASVGDEASEREIAASEVVLEHAVAVRTSPLAPLPALPPTRRS